MPAIAALVTARRAYGDVVNLGNPVSITIGELALRVKKLARSRAPIVKVPFEEAYAPGFEDIQTRQPDIRKAQRLIDFKPRRALEEILTDVIRWERHRRKG